MILENQFQLDDSYAFIVSIPRISIIFWKEGGGGGGGGGAGGGRLKNFFGEDLDGKRGINFWRGFRIFRDSNYNFYITTLIWPTIYTQVEKFCITFYFSLMFLAYFVLLKVFLIVSYFINNLCKRKSVKNIYAYPKSTIFSPRLSSVRIRKCYWKYLVWRGGYKKVFAGGRVWTLMRGLEIFQKRGGLTR